MNGSEVLFDQVTEFPNLDYQEFHRRLVGLDEIMSRLHKQVGLLLQPENLKRWSKTYHKTELALTKIFRDWLPLFIFAGDVGTGKTALAKSFCDPISRAESIKITQYRLSLSTRGQGTVGHITTLLTEAFREVRNTAKGYTPKKFSGKINAAVALLIDEADALAQSREIGQMHHEDRAGVNALIRGLDSIAGNNLPVFVVMCTNRLKSIDPAIKRRAIDIFTFNRPNSQQRLTVLKQYLEDTGIGNDQIEELVKVTGKSVDRDYGFTYSDLVQRLLPSILLEAYPDRPIDFNLAYGIANEMKPTPPFNEEIQND